ncbi:MAG TPA: MipA/OmpV family protein [Steroidobacteraceae bacterium]|jgi:outer membrane protein|nr:MipA/OmpV family protein [Steroidobacteraceae bacterium]
MKISSLQSPLMMAALWAAAQVAHAQSAPAVPAPPPVPEEKHWRLGIALGYGERTNPLIQSDDIPLLVDLDIAWFGERWFFDNGDLGFELLNRPSFTTNVVARVNSDRAFFGKTNTRFVNFAVTSGGVKLPITDPLTGEPAPSATPAALKVPDRDYAIELGFETLMDGEWGHASLRAFHDVSGTHRGYEIAADYSYRWIRGRLSIAPSVGVAFKSARLNDYYWGVQRSEAGPTLLEYHADGGIGWEAGLRTSYYLTKNTRLAVSANYERLQDSVALSPLVERPYVLGYFAGIAWQF